MRVAHRYLLLLSGVFFILMMLPIETFTPAWVVTVGNFMHAVVSSYIDSTKFVLASCDSPACAVASAVSLVCRWPRLSAHVLHLCAACTQS